MGWLLRRPTPPTLHECLIQGGVELAHMGHDAAQGLEMALAIFDLAFVDQAIKALLWRDGQKLFGQSKVLFGGEAELIDEIAKPLLGLLDADGNGYFLLSGKQRRASHFAKVNIDEVIESIRRIAFHRSRRGLLRDGLDYNLNAEFTQLPADGLQFAVGLFGTNLPNVGEGEKALVAANGKECLDMWGTGGRSPVTGPARVSPAMLFRAPSAMSQRPLDKSIVGTARYLLEYGDEGPAGENCPKNQRNADRVAVEY